MIWVLLMAVAIALAATPSQSAPQSDRFVQDRFVISFWVDPPASEITDARYKQIADANFTVVHGAFGPKTMADVKKQLALCKKYDLMAIIKGDIVPIEKLPEGPNLWGYHLIDEPGTGGIPHVKETIEKVRKYHPGKLTYFNLLPDYASLGVLGASSYDEYVARFARETGADVLCMDYYPMLTPKHDGRDGYCGNLAVMRKYSLELGVPHWNFFNTMPYGPHHEPTESHLRWQVMTALAYGSKGVLYFCYWTPGDGPTGEFPKGGAIIAQDGQPTRHYEQAKRINFGVKNWGPTLMKLTSTAVVRVKPGENSEEKLVGTGVDSIKMDNEGGDYLVGAFKHEDGRRAVMINNYDHNYATWFTVKFDVFQRRVHELDPATGKLKAIRDESPWMPGLQLSLDSGEGRLFILPPK